MLQLLGMTPGLNARAAGATFALSIFIFCASTVVSQDISGVWLGQLSEKLPDGRVGHGDMYLRLRQSGTQITGVAGDTETAASPIENVTLMEKHLKFSVTTPGGLMRVELDVDGDAMEGTGHAFRSSDKNSWDMDIKLARSR